jgi:hypothetical protein
METKDETKRVAIHFYNMDNSYGENKNKYKKIVEQLTGFKWEIGGKDATTIEHKKKGFKYVGHDKFEEYTESEYSVEKGTIDAQKDLNIKEELELVNSLLKKKKEIVELEQKIKQADSKDDDPISLFARIFWTLAFGVPSVLLFIFNGGLLWLKIILSILAGLCLISVILYPSAIKKYKKTKEQMKNEIPENKKRIEELQLELNNIMSSVFFFGDYKDGDLGFYSKILYRFEDSPSITRLLLDFETFQL